MQDTRARNIFGEVTLQNEKEDDLAMSYACLSAISKHMVAGEGREQIRYVRTAHGAWHWGHLYFATSEQVALNVPGLCVFAGPVEGRKRNGEFLMPFSCVACPPPEVVVPGEIHLVCELPEIRCSAHGGCRGNLLLEMIWFLAWNRRKRMRKIPNLVSSALTDCPFSRGEAVITTEPLSAEDTETPQNFL